MRIFCYSVLVFLLAFCNTREENILINGRDDLWHITQMGQYRNSSYLGFYKFNSDASFDEIYFRNGVFEEIDSNPDIKDWHKWKQVKDSVFQIAYIDYRLVSLSDSVVLFRNLKREQDSLRLIRIKYKVKNTY